MKPPNAIIEFEVFTELIVVVSVAWLAVNAAEKGWTAEFRAPAANVTTTADIVPFVLALNVPVTVVAFVKTALATAEV